MTTMTKYEIEEKLAGMEQKLYRLRHQESEVEAEMEELQEVLDGMKDYQIAFI